jgi:phosphoserine aminotransferase
MKNSSSVPNEIIDYLHVTSNETIEGIQLREFNQINNNLIIDSSSDIGSYRFDWDNVMYLYAGAQKNLGIPGVTISIIRDDFIEQNDNPTYLNLSKLINKDSLLNTPPTFSIYVLKLVTDWMLNKGGVEYFEKQSIDYSSELYALLEKYDEHVVLPVEDSIRSRMNVVFNFKNDKNEQAFINESLDQNIIGIKGHRSVGGIRISLYNSIDRSSVDYLLKFMDSFFEKL